MKSPWITMWRHPRATMRGLMEANPRQGFVWLSLIYGFSLLLRVAQEHSLAISAPTWLIIVICAVLALPVGMALLCLYSIILYWIGKIFQGKAKYHAVRAAVCWSNITQLPVLVLWAMMIASFGRQLFFYAFYDQVFVGYTAFVVLLNFVGLLTFGIWGLIIFLHALSEVQGFSFWMALLNVVLVAGVLWLFGVAIGYTMNFIMGVGG